MLATKTWWQNDLCSLGVANWDFYYVIWLPGLLNGLEMQLCYLQNCDPPFKTKLNLYLWLFCYNPWWIRCSTWWRLLWLFLKKLYDFLTLEYYHSIKYRWIHIHLLAFGCIVEHICFEDAPIWQSLVRGWSGLLSSKTACILSTNDWKKSSTAAFC